MLLGYINGRLPCPAQHITNPRAGDASALAEIPNPVYEAWMPHDQAILSFILSNAGRDADDNHHIQGGVDHPGEQLRGTVDSALHAAPVPVVADQESGFADPRLLQQVKTCFL
jgi:hypothetical protein